MKKITFSLLVCISAVMLFFNGYAKAVNYDKGLSEFAKINFTNDSDFLKYKKSSGLSVGFDSSQYIFVAMPETMSSGSDRSLIISALTEFSEYFSKKVERKGETTVSTSSLSIFDLKIIVINKDTAKTLSHKIVLLHKDKVVYEESIHFQVDTEKVNLTVKTDLTVKQLLQLLEDNNLRVEIAAYCRSVTEKAAIIVLKIPQKNQQ